MPNSLEPFWGAVHSSLQEQLHIVSPYLWSAFPWMERVGRLFCYLRFSKLLHTPPDASAIQGAVIAGCTLMAGSFFPSLEKGVKAALAAQCAQNLFLQCLVIQKALCRIATLVSSKYPPLPPRLAFYPSLFSPSFTCKVRMRWQRTALFTSLLCQAIWKLLHSLATCTLLLGEISLVMQGETAIQFTLLSSLASPKRRIDEEMEDGVDSFEIEEQNQVNWMECIRAKCGLKEEYRAPPRISPSKIMGDSVRDVARAICSPGKITPFSVQLNPSASRTRQMGRFPPIWKKDPCISPKKSSSHPSARRSLLGMFSHLFSGNQVVSC